MLSAITSATAFGQLPDPNYVQTTDSSVGASSSPPSGGKQSEENGTDGCFGYGPVTLSGVLKRLTFPGRPNFESVADGDEPETGFYLEIENGICVTRNTDEDSPPEAGVKLVQLQLDSAGYASLRSQLGQVFTVQGNLWHSYTMHHHSPLLLTPTVAAKVPPSEAIGAVQNADITETSRSENSSALTVTPSGAVQSETGGRDRITQRNSWLVMLLVGIIITLAGYIVVQHIGGRPGKLDVALSPRNTARLLWAGSSIALLVAAVLVTKIVIPNALTFLFSTREDRAIGFSTREDPAIGTGIGFFTGTSPAAGGSVIDNHLSVSDSGMFFTSIPRANQYSGRKLCRISPPEKALPTNRSFSFNTTMYCKFSVYPSEGNQEGADSFNTQWSFDSKRDAWTMTYIGIWNDRKESMERTNLGLAAWSREISSIRAGNVQPHSAEISNPCSHQKLKAAIDKHPAFTGGFEIIGVRETPAISGCGRVVLIEQPNSVSPYAQPARFMVNLACVEGFCAVGAIEDVSP